MHIAASVGYFIEYIMMHGTINIKFNKVSLSFIIFNFSKLDATIFAIKNMLLNTVTYAHSVNLTFWGPCIVSLFWYISKKMQHYTVYLSLETDPRVSGGITTHHQEHIQLYPQHLVLVKPLLLPVAITEEFFQLFHDSGSGKFVSTLPRQRYVA